MVISQTNIVNVSYIMYFELLQNFRLDFVIYISATSALYSKNVFIGKDVGYLVLFDILFGSLSRMCPPYPQRDRKRRLNGEMCRNHRIKR